MTNTSIFGAEILSASDAHIKAEKGELWLIDIRSPNEWKQTGVGEHAATISMHTAGFLAKLNAQMALDKARPIALICATGGRSAFLAGELERRGYTNIYDVSEGMFGSSKGSGWLAQKLPLKPKNLPLNQNQTKTP